MKVSLNIFIKGSSFECVFIWSAQVLHDEEEDDGPGTVDGGDPLPPPLTALMVLQTLLLVLFPMLISYSVPSDFSQTDSEIMMSPLMRKCLSLTVYMTSASFPAEHELQFPLHKVYEAVFGMTWVMDPVVVVITPFPLVTLDDPDTLRGGSTYEGGQLTGRVGGKRTGKVQLATNWEASTSTKLFWADSTSLCLIDPLIAIVLATRQANKAILFIEYFIECVDKVIFFIDR